MPNLIDRNTELLQWKSAVLNRRAAAFNLITVGLTAILSIFGADIISNIFNAHPSASITAPTGPSVPETFRLAGLQENFNKGDVLWAASRRYDDGKYYPQDKACGIFNDETFDCGDYYLGNQEGKDIGKDFDLIVMRADIDAVRAFSAYQIQKKGNSEIGFIELPSGVEILDRVQVTRK